MAMILIVDDDAAVRGILHDLLAEKHSCNSASSAEEAFQYLEIENYDVLITDISMPGMSGVDLLKRVQLKDLNTPVIFVTGKGAEEDPELLMRLGAFAYVTKPFSLDHIESVVNAALAKGGSELETH